MSFAQFGTVLENLRPNLRLAQKSEPASGCVELAAGQVVLYGAHKVHGPSWPHDPAAPEAQEVAHLRSNGVRLAARMSIFSHDCQAAEQASERGYRTKV